MTRKIALPGFALWIVMSIFSVAWAQDEDFSVTKPVPSSSVLLQVNTADPREFDPFFLHANPGPFVWSSFSGRIGQGDHTVDFYGGLVSETESWMVGEGLSTGLLHSSATYRYHGLLGGVVRPVARLSVGTGQYWGQPIDGSFLGYAGGLYSYVMPEAGVEIVVRIKGHGYGIGVTAAYRTTLDMEMQRIHWDDKYTGGPFDPRSGADSLDEWITHIYPIFE